jgi:hypothetical protein
VIGLSQQLAVGMALTGAMLMLIGNSLVAGEFGRRRQAEAPAGESA